MESRGMRVRGAAIAFVVALLWSGASAGNITVYWGQNGNEASLANTCASGNFEFVMISFLIKFGNGQTPVLNLAGHCDPPSGTCQFLSDHIESCQASGVKVFLSLGGSVGNALITSQDDANDVATYLWKNYLRGNSDSRPLGAAILDGIDFDIESSTPNWDLLAIAVANLSTASEKVYLSAAPQCPYPDQSLDAALQTKLFDYVWIQFYNNPQCECTSEYWLDYWNTWINSVTTVQTQGFYLGLPAAPNASGSGYIEPNKLISDILPKIKSSSKYGGVMLWNKFYDEQTGYSNIIKGSVIMKPSLVEVPTLASV